MYVGDDWLKWNAYDAVVICAVVKCYNHVSVLQAVESGLIT